jgi:hydrogenase maturation protease
MSRNEKSILILGFGSDGLMDDGIPIRISEDLKKKIQSPEIIFSTSALGGLELPELLNGYDIAVLIDTIKTPGGKPGDVHCYSPENFLETYHLSSNHDISFRNALILAETLGYEMPAKIVIFAIEIVENQILEFSLSSDIQRHYQEILCKIEDLLSDII